MAGCLIVPHFLLHQMVRCWKKLFKDAGKVNIHKEYHSSVRQ